MNSAIESFAGKAFWLIIVSLLVVGFLVFFKKVGTAELYAVLAMVNAYIIGKAALSTPGNGKKEEAKEVKPSG